MLISLFYHSYYNESMNKTLTHGLLVISRHTESEWNLLGKWTGLTDVGLTEKGHNEARMIGEQLRGITFDGIYTSEQKRTHQTPAGTTFRRPTAQASLF